MSQNHSQKIKESLNLPKTSFPMRASLPQKEPEMLKFWKDLDIYKKMMQVKPQVEFVLPDGPPYANGHLHVGHALNKILKDIIFKYKNLTGVKTPYIPGWDAHGLPIELNVYKKYKLHGRSKKEIRDLCRKEAHHWIDIQKKEFIRLGVFGDWDNPYLTTSPSYEAAEVKALASILKNGQLYQGHKPVFWCTKLQTALAHAEVEYKDYKSLSIYVKFQVKNSSVKFNSDINFEKTFFIIWTTTPWTLPANTGLAFNADVDYGVYKVVKGQNFEGEFWIIADKLKKVVEEETSTQLEKCQSLKGSDFEHSEAKHPFLDQTSLGVLGDHVSLDAGTGCVHTAPGHGLDDFAVGQRYNLPVINWVDAKGCYTEGFKKYEGERIWDVNPKIVEDLKKTGHLVMCKEIVHSYPFGERSKAPLIFRATPQWFIKLDDKKSSLKDKACEAIEKGAIQFTPAWGKSRFKAMISSAPDWCISRQRTWGVPIPVFYCEACEKPLLDHSLLEKISQVMKVQKGIESYFEIQVQEWTKGYACECGNTKFKRGEDILDVWFDSGIYHTAFQKMNENSKFPADIYIEGSDQHRGWFFTSLFSALAAYGQAPFDRLVTHGFILDGKGMKMSKSLNNVVSLQDIIKTHGAEILRLWVSHEDYTQDSRLNKESFKRVEETYRKIRNSIRFLIGNLEDFDFKKDYVAFDVKEDIKKFKLPAFYEKDPSAYYVLLSMDGLVLNELRSLISKCTAYYEEYQFYKVYHELNSFFVKLSSEYLDIMKDRLYTSSQKGLLRRTTQTVLYILLDKLTLLMSPILSFLSEEIHSHLRAKDPTRLKSVFLMSFPKEGDVPQLVLPEDKTIFKKTFKESKDFAEFTDKSYKYLFEIRNKIYKVIEEMKVGGQVRSSLEVELYFYTNKNSKSFAVECLDHYSAFLREFFIVSKVEIATYTPSVQNQYVPLVEGEVFVDVKKTKEEKCTRCWSYNKLQHYAPWDIHFCSRCIDALI